MATNIVTSDGKDLDSRYLGISAKAASATVADSANSIAYSKVSGRPSGLSFGGTYSYNKTTAYGTVSLTFTAPNNIVGSVSAFNESSHEYDDLTMTFVVNGKTLVNKKTGEGKVSSGTFTNVFLKKGQTMKVTGTTGDYGSGRVNISFSGAIWAFS